jgi:[ribosomal protein S5]-alanine N-acetyltransferase
MDAAEDVFQVMPELPTARLLLRRITEADAAGLFDVFSDDEVTEYYAWDTFTDPQQGRELAAASVEQYHQRTALRWGLALSGTSKLIGTCGYTRWNQEHRFAILGYDLARAHWGRGLITEAVATVVGFGFEKLDLNRVEATVLAGNTASIAVLNRAGFRLEGHFAERAWHRGTFHDVQMYGLLRSAWLAAAAPGSAAPADS